MEARVKLIDHMTLLGESASGHGIVMDARKEFGGRDLGPTPMEMMLLGAGGCTSIDVLSILRKSREPVEDVEIKLSADRADTHPRVFTRIHIHVIVTGKVKESTVARAVQLSAEKYCSASAMLGHTAEMTHSYEIV